MNLIKIILYLILFYFIYSFAEDNQNNVPYQSISKMINKLACDSPLPLVDAKEGVWFASAKPTYFTVKQLRHDEALDYLGNGLKGYALSSAYSKSLDERWQVYGILNSIKSSGRIDVVSNTPFVPGSPAHTTIYTVESKATVSTFSTGLGYDLLREPKNLAIAVFFGPFFQYYNVELKNNGAIPTVNEHASSTTKGQGLLYGLSTGLQLQLRFYEKFYLQPYFFLGAPFNKAKLTTKITGTSGVTQGDIEGTRELRGEPFFAMGLSFGYIPWGLSINIFNLLPAVNTDYKNLKMTVYSITFTFGNSDKKGTS